MNIRRWSGNIRQGAMLLVLTWALPVLAANPAGSGPAAALAQTKNLIVGDGMEVSLFASEPMVRNPAAIDIDSRGRVWVTEGANYRLFQKWGKIRPEGDRIVILEDTNRDGAADKETTFYQGNEINTALGICVIGEKVYVSCAPNVFIFTDANRDDKADGPPQVLFTGIKGVDHDHGVHSFVFGPDGKLYFNQGNDGREIHRPDGSLVKDVEGREVITRGKPFRQGLAFRCNLDGSEFEVLGHNFRNNYELCVDSFGTVWQSDNDDDGNRGVRINYLMEHGNFGYTDEMTGASWSVGWRKAQNKGASEELRPSYHWHQFDPGVVPNLLQTGAGSPTGILIYEGRALPSRFHNQLIHCDPGPRVVRSYVVEKAGAGYKARIENVLSAGEKDTWFRPSDVAVQLDGSLLVADWNDAGVGGHAMADTQLETMTGRIYHVRATGEQVTPAAFNPESLPSLIAGLQSPNLATRAVAWLALHAMKGRAERELVKLWRSGDAQKRVRGLHLLARLEGKGRSYVAEALRDPNEDIRVTGLRVARQLKMDLVPILKTHVRDNSAQVRRECALALHHHPAAEVPQLWATLAAQFDGQDRWYLEALGIGADERWDACLDAWMSQVPAALESPAGREIVWRSRAKKSAPLLVQWIKDSKTSESDRARYFRALDFLTGPEKEAALLDLLTGSTK